MWDVTIVLKNTHISDDSKITDWIPDYDSFIMPRGVGAFASDSDTDTDNNEHYDGGPCQVKQFDDKDEGY
jgi:hypothetical protein